MQRPSLRLDGTGCRTALVRAASPTPRPSDVVSVTPGTSASFDGNAWHAPLVVTAHVPSGRTALRRVAADPRAVADAAMSAAAEYDPATVWLCGRDRVVSWWTEGTARLLEHRLAAAAGTADAPLVVWTAAKDGAVEDRYDVVFDP